MVTDNWITPNKKQIRATITRKNDQHPRSHRSQGACGL